MKLKRALYQCQACGFSWYPLYQRLCPLNAEKVILETSGVSLIDSSIRAISEATGSAIEAIIGAEIEESTKGEIQ